MNLVLLLFLAPYKYQQLLTKGQKSRTPSVIQTASAEASETLVNPAHDAVTGQEIPGTKRTH